MPTYQYECDDCGEQFTVDESMKDHVEQEKPKCPKCNKAKSVRQIVSSVHVKTSRKA